MDTFQLPVKTLGSAFRRYGEWVAGHKSRAWYMIALGIALVLILTPGMLVAALRDAEDLDSEELFTPRVSTGAFIAKRANPFKNQAFLSTAEFE